MTSLITSVLDGLFAGGESRVLVVGDNASGKTTMLYKLKLGEVVTTIPTIGFNVETVVYKNISFTMWDVGGKDKIRPLWRHYYQNTQAIIFMINSTRDDNIDDAQGFDNNMKDELNRMLAEDELRDALCLVFANFQDQPTAMSVEEITERLGLRQLRNRLWYIQGCCALTGEGIYEGMDWLCKHFGTSYSVRNLPVNINRMKEGKRLKVEAAHRAEEKAQKQMRKHNQLKVILAISGYVRAVVKQHTLMTFVPAQVTKLIHLFFQEQHLFFDDKYLYFGELSCDDHDDGGANEIEFMKPEVLLQFLARPEVENEYISDDEAFLAWYMQHRRQRARVNDDDGNQDDGDKQLKAHYDFLRMIWILFSTLDRRKGLKQIWEYTPYSVTVTYFWSQLVYFGMYRHINAESNAHIKQKFEYFLVMNPCLSNNFDGLLSEYYSTRLMLSMNGDKKEEMLMPDLKPLPSVITNVAELKQKQPAQLQQQNAEMKTNTDDDDDAFIQSFENKTYKRWDNHRSFLRVVWCYLEKYDAKKPCVAEIRAQWQKFKGDAYHETTTYFWIHMARYFRMLYKQNRDADSQQSSSDSFADFLQFCTTRKKQKKEIKCKILEEMWWREFYSDSVMNHHNSSQNMVLPDKQHLPQLVLVSSQQK